MKFENTSVYNFKNALRGMRNPKESWSKNDTREYVLINANDYSESYIQKNHPCYYINNDAVCVSIGPNDMQLAQKLIKAGSEHRKFMRQIMVSVDITAPLFWWKEFDTYKVGTTANSTSTMHKLSTTPITLDRFETDDMDMESSRNFTVQYLIPWLEELRHKYLETKKKKVWKELIRWLPDSWLQKRTVTMSYENLLAMCSKGQRRSHPLNEWSGKDEPEHVNFIKWARTLPYAQELIFLDELETK